MKTTTISILILIFSFSFLNAKQKTPVEIVKQYYNAYLNDDWQIVAGLTDPVDLSLFKKHLKKDFYKIAASDMGLNNIDSLFHLSDEKLYAFFLKFIYSKDPYIYDSVHKLIIGTVYENKATSYVVYKTGENYVDVIKLKKINNEWKIDKLDAYIKLTFMEPVVYN